MGYLVTQIIDQGCGIGKENQKNIFGAFNPAVCEKNQGLSSTGVGVGLTTAQNLVHSLGGEIFLKSERNAGTQVTFSILTRDRPQNIKQYDLFYETLSLLRPLVRRSNKKANEQKKKQLENL